MSLNTDGYHELYRASKAALNSLTRGLWPAVKDRGITLLTLHPGWVRTDMGGPGGRLSIEESVPKLVTVLLSVEGSPGLQYLDYLGHTVPW